MINDELLAKFDRIQDLPVSEEMLGAYLEEELTPSELFEIEVAMQDSPSLQYIVDSSINVDGDSDIKIPDSSCIDNYCLPIVPSDDFIGLDSPLFSQETEDYEVSVACAMDSDNVLDSDDFSDPDLDNPFEEDDYSLDSLDNNDSSDYE